MDKVVYYNLDMFQQAATKEIEVSLRGAGFKVISTSKGGLETLLTIMSENHLDSQTLIKIGIIIGQATAMKLSA